MNTPTNKQNSSIPAALLCLSLTFGLSACFHDDEEDTHHDASISVHLHEDEVVDVTKRNEAGVEGTAAFEFHETEKELKGSVTFTDTPAPTSLHIHSGFAGQTGGIVITLNDTATSGTWVIPEASETLTDEQIETLEAGGFYLNAHFADGTTIRGQIVTGTVTFVVADLAAATDVTSTGKGVAGVTINNTTRGIISYVTVAGLAAGNSISGIHLHFDKEDNDVTPPLFPKKTLTVTANTSIYSNDNGATDDNDTLTLTEYEEAEAGLWYVNVHTNDNADGELKADFGVFPSHTH